MRLIDISELSQYTVPARGYINNIYLHWSAGRYDQQFSDYHINIDGEGHIYIDGEFTDLKSHTWRRNTGAIGIAIDCCFGAVANTNGDINYGDYPPTEVQLDTLAKVVAKLCIEIGIDINYNVLTHAEAADIDGYGLTSGDSDCRWDLYDMGSRIRANAIEYMNQWRT